MVGLTPHSKIPHSLGLAAKLITLLAALGLQAAFLFAVFNPKVSPEYRDYYIDRTAKHWRRGEPYPEVDQGKSIFPGKSPAKSAVLGMGWSDPDKTGAWSEAPTAHLFFRLSPSLKQDFELTLTGKPFDRTDRDFQTADLIVNGQNLQTLTFKGPLPREYKVKVPFSIVEARNGYVSVALKFEGLKSPRELRMGADFRKLGILMTDLRIDPL